MTNLYKSSHIVDQKEKSIYRFHVTLIQRQSHQPTGQYTYRHVTIVVAIPRKKRTSDLLTLLSQ